MSDLVTKLVFDAHAEEWNEFDLPKLPVKEIQALCSLLGAPKSGSKEKIVIRLLAVRQVRLKIAAFSPDPEGMVALADAYRKEALKWMAKEAGLWRSGNKIQLANVLINWRERCRHEGQKILNQWKSESVSQPRQMLLPL